MMQTRSAKVFWPGSNLDLEAKQVDVFIGLDFTSRNDTTVVGSGFIWVLIHAIIVTSRNEFNQISK